jgi:hypothetical protein
MWERMGPKQEGRAIVEKVAVYFLTRRPCGGIVQPSARRLLVLGATGLLEYGAVST